MLQILFTPLDGAWFSWGSNKYYFTMRKYPDDIVITVDDGVKYKTDLIELLMRCYEQYPYAVTAMRTHMLTFDNNRAIKPYSKWKLHFCGRLYKPCMSLIASGASGVLYPPHLINHPDLFDADKLIKLSLLNDDLWLKFMELLSGVPVVLAAETKKIQLLEGMQEAGLRQQSEDENQNDLIMGRLLEEYNGEDNLLINRMYSDNWDLERIELQKAEAEKAAAAEKEAEKALEARINEQVKKRVAAILKEEREKAKPLNVIKRAIKKVLPMPTNRIMREMTALRRNHREMEEKLAAVSDQSKKKNDMLNEMQGLLASISEKENGNTRKE